MFEEIEKEIGMIRAYLATNPDKLESSLETILAKSLVLTICSSYEEEIMRIVKSNLESSCDGDTAGFLHSIMKASKYLAYDQLRGNVIGKFGDSYLKTFDGLVTERSKSAYETLIRKRNTGSHTTLFSMTFKDVLACHADGSRVIIALRDALQAGRGPDTSPTQLRPDR